MDEPEALSGPSASKPSSLRVPFGERDGRLYAPAQVESGLKCGCFCPHCSSTLLKKTSQRNRSFFAHFNADECVGGYETALHKMAKQIIADERKVTLPSRRVEVTAELNGSKLSEPVNFPPRIVELFDATQEQAVERWRPDVTAMLRNGDPIFIEVRVTHAVSDDKAGTLKNVLEIDLSKLPSETVDDEKALRQEVLHDAPRCWFNSSPYDHLSQVQKLRQELLQRLQARPTQMLRPASTAAEDTYAESVEANRRRLREEYAPALEELSNLAVQGAKALNRSLNTPEAVTAAKAMILERMGQVPEADAVRFLQFYTRNNFSDGWIFNVAAMMWQSVVIVDVIFSRRHKGSVKVIDALNAVTLRHPVVPWMDQLAKLKSSQKRQGKERAAWYGEKGAWFLEEHENRAIVAPYRIMVQFLDELCAGVCPLLKPVEQGKSYVARYETVEECVKALDLKSVMGFKAMRKGGLSSNS